MSERDDDNGCCCHAVHEDLPADEHGPFIAGEPRTADCCAVKRAATRDSLAACQRELAKAREEAEWKAARVGEVVTPIIQRAEAAEAERDKMREALKGLQCFMVCMTCGHEMAYAGKRVFHTSAAIQRWVEGIRE